ncbi:MAG: cobalamin-dependent protein, partial [Cyclobacteriaceae bacterium]|nr:cobalamin-dependent protein [Cyclobacteriaceae bacterium]
VEAAKVRATLGEISTALEEVYGRFSLHSPAITGIYSRMAKDNTRYQQVIALAEKFEKMEGRRPRIMVAKLGQDGHDRGARVIATSFADMGFDVDIAPMFQTPREIAIQAAENDVHIIGISSLAGAHNTLITGLLENLKDIKRQNIMVIAGGIIPEKDRKFLLQQGVAMVFGPGTVLTDAAEVILTSLLKS